MSTSMSMAWQRLATARQCMLRASNAANARRAPCASSTAALLRTRSAFAAAVPRQNATLFARWSSTSKPSATEPLGLKDSSSELGISPTMKIIGAYITVSMIAMITIARYKDRDAAEEESARVYNMAKRAVVKDRRFFEAIGYPKEFEPIVSTDAAVDADASSSSSTTERTSGAFRVIGDKGTAIVTYKQGARPSSSDSADNSASDVVTFDELHVELADGTAFSALDAFLTNASVASQQASQSLGKKLFFPVIGGVVLGGIASFFVIRILRNRPSYVHKLVLDHVNNHDVARSLLGHPIKSNRKEYIGSLTHSTANYTIACSGPKGDGTLIVKAFKDEKDAEREASAAGPIEIMTTPGTAWKFSTLVLSVKRNSSARAKNSKMIDLLSGTDTGTGVTRAKA